MAPPPPTSLFIFESLCRSITSRQPALHLVHSRQAHLQVGLHMSWLFAFICSAANPEFQHKSLDEMRWEDYRVRSSTFTASFSSSFVVLQLFDLNNKQSLDSLESPLSLQASSGKTHSLDEAGKLTISSRLARFATNPLFRFLVLAGFC